MSRRDLLHTLVELDAAINLNDEALGYDSLDGPAAHLVLRAQHRMRIARDHLRAELGIATIPHHHHRESAA